MFKQTPPQPTSEAIKIIAFSSGEGGPLAVDEEDTVQRGKGKGDKVLFLCFGSPLSCKALLSSSVNHGGRKQPHIRFASVIDTFSAGEGYGCNRF